jgi:hypothetical protein
MALRPQWLNVGPVELPEGVDARGAMVLPIRQSKRFRTTTHGTFFGWLLGFRQFWHWLCHDYSFP